MIIFKKFKSYFISKSPEIKRFEDRIQYKFYNTYYLNKALTHRSIQNHSKGNYERLEFLGDAIIDHVVSHWLFNKYEQSDEGTLTKKRAALVNRNFLARLGNNLKITEIIYIDPGVNLNDSKVANNICADVYEAIVGAIYLDGGYKNAANFIKRTLCLSEYLASEDSNYKGQLIEYCHSKNLSVPQFEVLESHGPEHERIFTIKVLIDNEKHWIGRGTTKKEAEQDASQRAIKSLLRS